MQSVMGRPGIQMWGRTLCVFLSWMCVVPAVAGPQYMVAVPAVLEAGVETKFCASLLQPNETLVMTVTLMSEETNTTLIQQTSSEDFHICTQFTTPSVEDEVVQEFQVEVRGDTFYSKEVRKVMIRSYQPMTFIQTDKPIYLPGQTVKFRVISLDTKMRPAQQMYNTIEIELSYALNPEAREGSYQVTVSTGSKKIYHSFKVEKYVLPKFDVKLTASDEVSIDQEEIKAEVCATYTYGQPVPGSVNLEMCRHFNNYIERSLVYNLENPEGVPEISAPCYKETKQHPSTGISHQQEKSMDISYVVGKLSFTDTPKIYDQGSIVEGKVKAVCYNNTPIADMPVYLFEGERWSARWLQNLTTDSNGVAPFSFSTANLNGDIHIQLSNTPTMGYAPYRAAHYETGDQLVLLAQVSSPDTKTVSFLEVKKKDKPLPCDKEEEIFIQYTVVGEAKGSVDMMYLVLSRGAIVMQGHNRIDVEDQSVNEGQVSFKLTVSPDMAPDIQVIIYAMLPSETVIANSADFSIEKCFSNKVSLEFSPSSAVPGEQTILQVKALPDSLCGVSAVDQSVLIKEPGKTLDADKIFNLLPVRKATNVPYNVEDRVECLLVRPRRYAMPYPDGNQRDDAHAVFQVLTPQTMMFNIAIYVAVAHSL
ncbi:hypothetical protein F7725_020220 [Dissostichus mawsoni]|uniref:Alpha-2-macroglobulin bait region domain-containing protein n=1 Tax=Dissostichus mawsoni TaxID=36200 RepID=A0A7J5YCL0_DISMA|nr:hypothetical protein F7725_020220 [Dissostichus mawsoni]